jgi:hypothetical protein
MFFFVYDVIKHFTVLFSSTFYKLQRLKNISYLFISFSRHFSEMLEFISFGFFLIMFYLEDKGTTILKDFF